MEIGGQHLPLSEALDRYGPEAVVAYLSSGHYRQPLAFSDEALGEAAARVEGIRNYLRDAPAGEADEFVEEAAGPSWTRLPTTSTPRRPSRSLRSIAEGNRRELPGAREVWRSCCRCWGSSPCSPGRGGGRPRGRGLLAEREQARAAKDFDRADQIRDQLAELGWEVRDEAGGARLVRRR